MNIQQYQKLEYEWFICEHQELPRHDKVPNLKLVMNPEGKLHDWTDLPPEELPEMQILAQGGLSPDTAHHVVENLEACKGRGKQDLVL